MEQGAIPDHREVEAAAVPGDQLGPLVHLRPLGEGCEEELEQSALVSLALGCQLDLGRLARLEREPGEPDGDDSVKTRLQKIAATVGLFIPLGRHRRGDRSVIAREPPIQPADHGVGNRLEVEGEDDGHGSGQD